AMDFADWRRRKAGGVAFLTVDAQGHRVPGTLGNAWAKEVERLVSSDDDFRRLLARGLIPPQEIEAARAGGLKTWRALRAKYGSPNPPVEDPRFGRGAA